MLPMSTVNQHTDNTWHMTQKSVLLSEHAALSKLQGVTDDENDLVFKWLTMTSSDNPVFTVPICSPNARSSWRRILKWI